MTLDRLDGHPRGSAAISKCGRYRYHLIRQVGPKPEVATFIMLNPSTADATTDDPTIRKCMGFARRLGCGQLQVVNLFAVRATDPSDMRRAADPVGPENAAWIERAIRDRRGPVVCAWGVHGAYRDQDLTLFGWLDGFGIRPVALGITKDGHPGHPLYVPYAAQPVPFEGRRP